MKILSRTFVYKALLVLSGIAAGFVINAEYVCLRSTVIDNLFLSIQVDDQVEIHCKNIGRQRLIKELGMPSPDRLQFIKEEVIDGEQYATLFKYTTPDGNAVLAVYKTQVRWKSLEDSSGEKPVSGMLDEPTPAAPLPGPKEKSIEIPEENEEYLHEGALITKLSN